MLVSKFLSTCAVILVGLQLAASSCSSEYPGNVTSDREFSGDVITPTLPVPKNKYTYIYYNAEAGVPFKVKFNEYSGFFSPEWYIARAVNTLTPTYSGTYEVSTRDDGFSEDEAITPTASECYAIGIAASEGGSVGIRFITNSTISPAAPTQLSCPALFPGVVTQECYGNCTLDPVPIPSNSYKYVYFRAKAKVPFQVNFTEYSGSPVWYLSRTVLTATPTFSDYEFASRYWPVPENLVITPQASECYSIGVTNNVGGIVGLLITEEFTLSPGSDGSDRGTVGPSTSNKPGKRSPLPLILGLSFAIPLVLALAFAAFRQVKKNKRDAREGANIPLSKATSP